MSQRTGPATDPADRTERPRTREQGGTTTRQWMTALVTRISGVPGACGLLAGRGLALGVAAATAITIVGASAGTASASPAPHRDLRYGAQNAPESRLSLARAPAALRAAVHRTLGMPAAAAGSAFQQGKLTASDGAAEDDFGLSVAISGSTAVVGAPIKNSATGAAYVFVRSGSTWLQQAKLTAADGAAGDRFGSSVAIAKNTVAVGAYFKNSGTGAAYVFTRSGTGTWSQQAEVSPTGGSYNEDFGISIALSGSTMVVGADGANSVAGAAYVYTGSGGTWSRQAVLTDPVATADDRFGEMVAISGSAALVGAPGDNGTVGAAYVFTRSAGHWSDRATLTASDGADGDNFGTSVALTGSTAVVGAPDPDGTTPGAAYVYTGSGGNWAQQAKLTAADGAGTDGFGYSVATSGSTVVVGALFKNASTGGAYVFTSNGSGWTQQSEPIAADGAEHDYFGAAVALSGSTAIVGAPYQNSNTGAAYAFVLPSQQAKLTASDAAAQSFFGYSVGMSGSTAVVGAPESNGQDGSAYVFTRSGSTWTQQAELTGPDRTGGDFFGYSVGVSGSKVVVGAFGDDTAYVFTRSGSTWTRRAALTDPVGSADDDLGYSVAISGSTIVVGAPGTTALAGDAYVYAGSGGKWFLQSTLTDPGATGGDRFGYSVAISGSATVVGAPGAVSRSGAAYVYTGSGGTWTQQAQLAETYRYPGDAFGASVAISGSTAVVGAPAPQTSRPGAAYVFATGPSGTLAPQATLTAADGVGGDALGWSVAVSGSTVLAGAIARNTGTGAAYVYTGSGGTWAQQAELTASDGSTYDYFGAAVGISGSTALVPAYGTNNRTGATYVFGNV